MTRRERLEARAERRAERRPRGVVGETPGDAPGPGESLGATRAVGYAVPAALPKGTHRAFRAARFFFFVELSDVLARKRYGLDVDGLTPGGRNQVVPPGSGCARPRAARVQ